MTSLSHKLTEREAKEVIQKREEESNLKKGKPAPAPALSPASQHSVQKWMAKLATFESLDYDVIENSLYLEEVKKVTNRQRTLENLGYWVILTIVGTIIGMCANIIHFSITNIAQFKFYLVNYQLQNGNLAAGFFISLAHCMLFMGIAVLLIVKIEPEATGSGIPEVKAYLNGVSLPKCLTLKAFIVKVLGVIATVASGACAGYEGPMIHIGALVGDGIPAAESRALGITSKFSAFRNDKNRRDFVSTGAAAGLAAAFTAPVGGLLFALEEIVSFWPSSLTWRTLYTCIVATFVNAALTGLEKESIIPFPQPTSPGFSILELIPFAFTGLVGGLMGSLFNILNIRLNTWRRGFFANRKWYHRLIEVLLVAIVTTLLQFFIPVLVQDCKEIGNLTETEHFNRFWCAEGSFSPMASLFQNTQGGAITLLFSRGEDTSLIFPPGHVAIYFLVYFVLAVVTSGLAVPGGLFLPFIIMGGCVGRFAGIVLKVIFKTSAIDPGTYALVGTAALITGATRMTVSIGVIILELTDDISFLMPILLAIVIARYVGDAIVGPLYDELIEIKNIPFLHNEPHGHHNVEAMTVANLMAQRDLKSFGQIERVSTLYKVLLNTRHNGFPVVSHDNRLEGVILRSQLLVLLSTKTFLKKDAVKDPLLMMPDSTDVPHQMKTDLSQSTMGAEDYLVAETPKKSLRQSSMSEEIHLDSGYQDMDMREDEDEPQSPEPEKEEHDNSAEMPIDQEDQDTDSNHTDSDDEEGAEDLLAVQEEFENVEVGQAPARAQLLADWLKTLQNKAAEVANNARVQFENFADAAAFEKAVHLQLTAKDMKLTEEEKGMLIDLRPYMHTSPYVVTENFRLKRAFELFRAMGLRHLFVVDSENKLKGLLTRKDLIQVFSSYATQIYKDQLKEHAGHH